MIFIYKCSFQREELYFSIYALVPVAWVAYMYMKNSIGQTYQSYMGGGVIDLKRDF